MITIQQMQYLLALNDHRQFQRASEACFVTQPTLSMQVKKAEESLGHVIFDRSAGLELTAFGETIIPVIRDVLNEYDRINKVIDRAEGAYKEKVRMAVIPTVATYLIPALFDRWRKRLPEIQLSITEMKTQEILVALEEKKLDVGILAGPLTHPKWRTIPLFREEIQAFLPEVEAEEVDSVFLESFQPWLLTKGNCLRTQMVHFCNLSSEDNDWSYEGGNIRMLISMVKKHGGYTLVPVNAIRKRTSDYKRIRSATGEVPARSVIGVLRNRSDKWASIEQLLREVQLTFANNESSESSGRFKVLDWSSSGAY